jgi:hypothetical protein
MTLVLVVSPSFGQTILQHLASRKQWACQVFIHEEGDFDIPAGISDWVESGFAVWTFTAFLFLTTAILIAA